MHRSTMTALLALALGAAACPKEGKMEPGDSRPGSVPRARDGNIAIQQELDAARKAGTLEAYDLFIARHPGHPLAGVARREREEIARGRQR